MMYLVKIKADNQQNLSWQFKTKTPHVLTFMQFTIDNTYI